MFRRRALALLAAFLLPTLLAAQTSASNEKQIIPLPQPPDLRLFLQAEDGRAEFHLGELVKLKVGYSSPIAGKYVVIRGGSLQPGEHSFDIQCTPSATVRDVRKPLPGVDVGRMLNSGPGCGVGLGSGFGGGCGDCSGEIQVTEKPDWWFPVLLNYMQQFAQHGEYTCTATASDVRLVSSSKEMPIIYRLTSEPLKLAVAEDAAWSKRSLDAAAQDWETRRCAEQKENEFLGCSEDAQTIRFLNTDDSLRAAVTFYPGPSGWGTGEDFFKAIMENPNRKLALKLLRKRTLEKDFPVTETLAMLIVGMEIGESSPAAYDPASDPSVFHEQAISKLWEYLHELGVSLSRKKSKAQGESKNTFEQLATRKYCNEDPLFTDDEVQTVLLGLPKQE